MASLVLYGSKVASAVAPTTACQMSTTTGGTETSATTTLNQTHTYGEITSLGGTVNTVTSLPSPTGKGWVYSPGAGTFATGNWSASIALSAVGFSVEEIVRFYKYSGGTYTAIGSITDTTGGVQGRKTVNFTATSMSTVTFAAGDLLYVDLWWYDNNTNSGGDNPTVYESSSATAGVTSDMQITTSSFTASGGVSLAGSSAGAATSSATLSTGGFSGSTNGVATASATLTHSVPLAAQADGIATASATLTTSAVGTFTVANTFAATGLDYPPQRKLVKLCDGSLLAVYQSSATVLTLIQLAGPNGSPTVTTLAQTFTVAGATNIVADLYAVSNGTTTSDVWLAYGDSNAGVTLYVAHGTYTASGSSWSWDNTGTSVANPTDYPIPSLAWTGTTLILATRSGSFQVSLAYTPTKNGSTSWTALTLFDSASGTSHHYPMLLHDATNACTLIVYVGNVTNDAIYAQVLPDGSTPANANWSAAATLSPGTFTNQGAANFSAALDEANSRLHVVWIDTGVSTNPQYNTATYTTTAITPGTSFAAGNGSTTAVGVDVLLDAASPPKAYLFWGSGAIGSASDIEYVELPSPYGSGNLGTVTNLTNNTANNNAYPHVLHDALASAYVPLLYEHAVSPWAVIYDNTIVAGTGATTVALSGASNGVATATADVGIGSISGSMSGVATASVALTHSVPLSVASNGAATASLTLSTGTAGTGIGDLAVSTRTTSWPNSSNGAGSGTETDIIYTDSSNNGWYFGMIPTYGGILISTLGDVVNNVLGTNQNSLGTTTSDGHIHWLEQSGTGTWAGSEDQPWTLTELAPTGTPFRRYYKGTWGPDANGFNWSATICVYPGDPGLVAVRFDCINPGASAISLAGADGLEIALVETQQDVDTTWDWHNGGYGTLAGGNTTPWPTGSATGNPVAADPDYIYINPASGGSMTRGQLTVKQTPATSYSPAWSSIEIATLQNTTRMKLKVMGTVNSFPANTTSTVYLLHALKLTLTASDAAAIAADYISPGTPTMATGTFTAFNYDEAAYEFAAASNAVTTTLDLTPAHVTVRYKPRLKLTGWTAGNPSVTWGGTSLTTGSDYRFSVDTTNHIAYIQLYYDVVASGAGAGQRNNAQIAIVGSSANLSGSMDGVAGGSAALTISHPLAGAAAGVASATATVTDAQALTATASGVAGASISLTVGHTIVASANGIATAGATTTVSHPLVAASDGLATATANLVTGSGISGSMSGVATASATLTHSVPLVAEADGLATSGATLSLPHALTASASGAATAGVTLTHSVPLAGSADGVASASASLTTYLAGVADGTASAGATLSVAHPLVASSGGSATADATLTHSVPLSGASSGVASATASLLAGGGIVAEADGIATANATLTHSVGLVAASNGVSTANVDLPVTHALGGTASGVSGASATVTHSVSLGGTADGVASADGILTHSVPLSGSADGIATTTVKLTSGKGFTGESDGVATGSLSLSSAARLGGAADAVAGAQAILSLPHLIVGSSAGTSDASADVVVTRGITGDMSGAATAQAVLSLPHLIVGAMDGVGTATLDLTVIQMQVELTPPTGVTGFSRVTTDGTVLSGPPTGTTNLTQGIVLPTGSTTLF